MAIIDDVLTTSRFNLRNLNLKSDNLKNYLDWMRDSSSNSFILGVNPEMTLNDLKKYIASKNSSSEALLLGIFLKSNDTHIGNIKLEPLLLDKYACLGILIGETDWRGKGVGFEVIKTVAEFAFEHFNLDYIYLGVDSENKRAIDLYKKIGFNENSARIHVTKGIEMTLTKNK